MSPAQMSRISASTSCKSDVWDPGWQLQVSSPGGCLEINELLWLYTFYEIFPLCDGILRHFYWMLMSNSCSCYWFGLYQAIIGLAQSQHLGQRRFHIFLISPYSRPGFASHGEIKLNVKLSIDFLYISKSSFYLQARKYNSQTTWFRELGILALTIIQTHTNIYSFITNCGN